MADVAEGVSHHLHALAELRDGRVALLYGVELVVEEDGPHLLVGTEETLNGEPQIVSSLVVAFPGDVLDGVVDGAEDPIANIAVGLIPLGISGARRK